MRDGKVLFVMENNPTLNVTHPRSPYGINLRAYLRLDVDYTGEDFHAAHRYANAALQGLEELVCFSGRGWEATRDQRGVYELLGRADLPLGVRSADFYIEHKGFELHYFVYYISQPESDEDDDPED